MKQEPLRYLLYYVTKQSRPWFANELRECDLSSADDCSLVIVDLFRHHVYWNGEWRPCDVIEREDKS